MNQKKDKTIKRKGVKMGAINYPCGCFDVEQLPGGSRERKGE